MKKKYKINVDLDSAREEAEYLKSRLNSSSNLKVKTEKDGKFGRMLGYLYDEKGSLNEDMVARGYAWVYDGGTREYNINELRQKRDSYVA